MKPELLTCLRWHFNLYLIPYKILIQFQFNMPIVGWLSFLSYMKVWYLWVNTCIFPERLKSCPSESAAVSKWCGANNSSLCCSTQSVEYVKRRVWLALRLSRGFICCQRSMSSLQSMPISFIGFSLLLCYHMHHHHQYNIAYCGSRGGSVCLSIHHFGRNITTTIG